MSMKPGFYSYMCSSLAHRAAVIDSLKKMHFTIIP